MKTININFSASCEIKKSTFIAYLCPFCEFDKFHKELKILHQKSTHIVWAYRFLNNFNQIVENQSDDGEPKNTSGMPTLNALRGKNLINVACFVVRYFGGIKLGTGGLVRAYSGSANLVINEANLVNFEIKFLMIIFSPFKNLQKFEHFFSKNNIKFTQNFYENGANFSIDLTKDEFNLINNFLKTLHFDEFKILALPIFAKDNICEN